MPSQREYKNFPKQIWNFCFSSFADCKKIYRYNISLFSCSRFSRHINKSYFYRFTAINFTKLSWRTHASMIPFIPNPAEKVVVLTVITTTFSGWLPRKNVPPRNTPDSFCRRFTPTKSIAALRGRYFSFLESCTLTTAWAVRTWYWLSSQRRCTNRGRNFVRVNRRFYIRAGTLYLFFRLNNSETITRKQFWAKR